MSRSTRLPQRSQALRPTSLGAWPMRLRRRSLFWALTASLCCLRKAFLSRSSGEGEFEDVVEVIVPTDPASSSPTPPSTCICCFAISLRFALQLLLQVVTSSQHFSHFFLHVNGRLHTTQTFEGRFSLAIVFPFLFFMKRQTEDEYECRPAICLLLYSNRFCRRIPLMDETTDPRFKPPTTTNAGRKARPPNAKARKVAIVPKR